MNRLPTYNGWTREQLIKELNEIQKISKSLIEKKGRKDLIPFSRELKKAINLLKAKHDLESVNERIPNILDF